MTRYKVEVEYWARDGELEFDDVIVEADNEDDAKQRVLEFMGDEFNDADPERLDEAIISNSSALRAPE